MGALDRTDRRGHPAGPQRLLGTRTGSTASIDSTPSAAEYADLQTDAGSRPRACSSAATPSSTPAGGWQLVTGFKVGDLATEWVGQAQFDPQLIGYIEGAPPVPSENLTVQDSYTGASSVSLTEATTTTYTYASPRLRVQRDASSSARRSATSRRRFAGLLELEAPLGIGVGEIELTDRRGGARVRRRQGELRDLTVLAQQHDDRARAPRRPGSAR